MRGLKIKIVVMIGVFAVSTAGIMVKLSTASSLDIAFYRMFFSMIITGVFAFKGLHGLGDLTKKEVVLLGISGTALGLHFYTWFISLNYTSIANSMFFICMSPIFTVLGDYFIYKVNFSRRELGVIVLAIIGGSIMALHDGSLMGGELFGNLMALLGSFLIGVYLLIGRAIRQKLGTFTYTFPVYGVAACILFIIKLFTSNLSFVYPIGDWLIFVGLALVPTLFGHSLFSFSLKYVKTSFISTAVLFEPVLTILLAMFIFREFPDLLQIIGGSIILVSLLFFTIGNSQRSDIQ